MIAKQWTSQTAQYFLVAFYCFKCNGFYSNMKQNFMLWKKLYAKSQNHYTQIFLKYSNVEEYIEINRSSRS